LKSFHDARDQVEGSPWRGLGYGETDMFSGFCRRGHVVLAAVVFPSGDAILRWRSGFG
jgi:hypothetical protein